MLPFNYPHSTHSPRHGPFGYADYSSYRPWLRDEFAFRCVYCLKREQWGRVTGEFDLDHYIPQALSALEVLEYENLRYACRTCNSVKSDIVLPDPALHLTSEDVRILPDGMIEGRTIDARRLIDILDLNSPKATEWRLIWIRIVALAHEHDRPLYRQLMGFPEDLPNLFRLRPGGNRRLEGVATCYFAKKQAGVLPDTY